MFLRKSANANGNKNRNVKGDRVNEFTPNNYIFSTNTRINIIKNNTKM